MGVASRRVRSGPDLHRAFQESHSHVESGRCPWCQAPPQPQRPDGLRYSSGCSASAAMPRATRGAVDRGVTIAAGERSIGRARRSRRSAWTMPAPACSAVQVIDGAVGGGALQADLAVDPQGNAIAIWQQFEKDVFTTAPAATSRSTASTTPPAPGPARCSPRRNPATRSVRAQARQWAAKRCSGGSRTRAAPTASRRCCNH